MGGEHQRRRWMRHDAHRWLRPDYQRFLQPGVGPRPLLALFEGKANFNPSQPRVPAGNPGGGRWTDDLSGGDGTDSVERETDDTDVGSDEFSDSKRAGLARLGSRPHGHHSVPVTVYGGMKLLPETRKVFDEAKSGRLYGQTH